MSRMFKVRFIGRPFNQQIGIDFGSSLVAVAYIGTEQEVLTVVDEYGSCIAQIDASLL